MKISTGGPVILLFTLLGQASAQTPTPTCPPSGITWTRLQGNTADEGARKAALDPSGNVLVAGWTQSDPFEGLSSLGDYDVFLSKYDPAGTRLWTRLLGGAGWDAGFFLAIDGSGNTFITGDTLSNPFDGQANIGGAAAFLTKFDADGNRQWTSLLGGPGTDYANSVAVDAVGNAYVTGDAGSSPFEGLFKAGGVDMYLTKFDPDGNILWTRLLGGTLDDSGRGVAAGADGSIYVTGITYSDPFDGQANPTAITAFLVKYDDTGTKLWSRLFGGTGDDYGQGIAVDSDGDIYVSGWTYSDPFDGLANAGGADAFLIKYDSPGTTLWTKILGGTGYEEGYSVALDAAGNPHVTGSTASDSFDGLASAGNYDAFLVKYDAAGEKLWVRLMGGPETERCYGVALDAAGNALLTGRTESNPFLGEVNAGQQDAFLTKICRGESWTNTPTPTPNPCLTPPPDHFPPRGPQCLATWEGDRQIALTWLDSSTDANGISGYVVFRTERPFSHWEQISGLIDPSTPEFLDTDGPNGRLVYYLVAAFDHCGNRSWQNYAQVAVAHSLADTDGDDLPDDWERAWFGSLSQDSQDDPDNDGLNNWEEYMHGATAGACEAIGSRVWGLGFRGNAGHPSGTNPLEWDTDNDGLNDGLDSVPNEPQRHYLAPDVPANSWGGVLVMFVLATLGMVWRRKYPGNKLPS